MKVLLLGLLMFSGGGQHKIYVPDSSVPLRMATGHGHVFLWSRATIFELQEARFAKIGACKYACKSAAVLGDGRLALLDGRRVVILGATEAPQDLPQLPPDFHVRGLAADENLIVAYGSVLGSEITKNSAALHLNDEYRETHGHITEVLPSVLTYGKNIWKKSLVLPRSERGEVRVLQIKNGMGLALTAGHVLRTTNRGETWEDIPPKLICRDFAGGDCGWKDAAVSAQRLWLVGPDGFLSQSRDRGVTWKSEALGKSDLCEVAASDKIAVIKGCDGLVWKFSDAPSRIPGLEMGAGDMGVDNGRLWVLSSDSSEVEDVTLQE